MFYYPLIDDRYGVIVLVCILNNTISVVADVCGYCMYCTVAMGSPVRMGLQQCFRHCIDCGGDCSATLSAAVPDAAFTALPD